MANLYFVLASGNIFYILLTLALWGIYFLFLVLIYLLLFKMVPQKIDGKASLHYAFMGTLGGELFYYDVARFLLDKCPSYCPFPVIQIYLFSVFVTTLVFFFLLAIVFKRVNYRHFLLLILMAILNVVLFFIFQQVLMLANPYIVVPS